MKNIIIGAIIIVVGFGITTLFDGQDNNNPVMVKLAGYK
jgi:hypothetical protein